MPIVNIITLYLISGTENARKNISIKKCFTHAVFFRLFLVMEVSTEQDLIDVLYMAGRSLARVVGA